MIAANDKYITCVTSSHIGLDIYRIAWESKEQAKEVVRYRVSVRDLF